MTTTEPQRCGACGREVADREPVVRVDGGDVYHISCFMPAPARRRLAGAERERTGVTSPPQES